jgi:hypothetical protein
MELLVMVKYPLPWRKWVFNTAECSVLRFSTSKVAIKEAHPTLTESFFIPQDGSLSNSDRVASQPSVIGTNIVPQGWRRRYNKQGDPGSRR